MTRKRRQNVKKVQDEIRLSPGKCCLPEMPIKAIVIAGTQSGAGKTTITLALMAALTARGYKVAPFKVGPDFIDPGHHGRITGRTGFNLDGWMLDKATNLATFGRETTGADIAVIEGVMGLFDGYDGRSEAGSTAQMAKWLGVPVLLVVSARSMARSAAALVQGFERFDPDLDFAGVFFNHLGSARHLHYLQDALAGHVRMPMSGGLLRDEAIAIPERHLGLMTPEEHGFNEKDRQRLIDAIEKAIDIPALLQRLPPISPPAPPTTVAVKSPEVRIGIARDAAFCFYYQDNLDLLTAAGAKPVFFSPLNDGCLPPALDGVYLGGGYPEVHAADLEKNNAMRQGIQDASTAGMPIYGECGGFMYLCRAIVTTDGTRYAMSGCLPFTTQMLPRLKSLGYREITLTADTLLGPAGQLMRGHEFHYSTRDESPDAPAAVYRVSDRKNVEKPAEGFMVSNTLGSYIHLHFGSCPAAAGHFVTACKRFKTRRSKG